MARLIPASGIHAAAPPHDRLTAETASPVPPTLCDTTDAQRRAIRHKLRDDFSDLYSEPLKPKWMRRRTFQRYLDRDNELAVREMPYLARFLALEQAALVGKKRG